MWIARGTGHGAGYVELDCSGRAVGDREAADPAVESAAAGRGDEEVLAGQVRVAVREVGLGRADEFPDVDQLSDKRVDGLGEGPAGGTDP